MSLVSHHTCCKHWKVSVELKPNSITKAVPLKPVQQSNESIMRRVIMSSPQKSLFLKLFPTLFPCVCNSLQSPDS
jgi:hypothetical protein